MSKILDNEKIAAVKAYLEGDGSTRLYAKRLGVSGPTFREWVMKYKTFGESGLLSSTKRMRYTEETKNAAVTAYINGQGSQKEICEVYKIKDKKILRQWIMVYNGHKELRPSRGRGSDIYMTKGRNTTYEERVEIVSCCIEHGNDYTAAIEKYGVQKRYTIFCWIYNDCSELSRKLHLHSILLKLKEPSVEAGAVSCTVPAINYEIPEDGIADEDNCYRGFLSLVERYKGKAEADAIRRCLFGTPSLEEYVEDKYVSDGDSRIPAINTFPGSIFYSKEKCGDWADIPLAKKKVRLIAPEDPFLLTEMPRMVFDDEWFPNVNATHDGKSSPGLSKSDLHSIAHSHVGEDEIVLAASLWYPWGYREGTIYTEISKIDIPIKMERSVEFDACLGNYGLLINEQAMDETQDTTIGMGGVSLFNRVCGNLKLYFGNCQVAPASIWRDSFKCKPKDNNPYIWVDSSGQEILCFERIASPVREVMREAYIRQPILFRWVGNKTWLKAMLRCEHLCIIPFGIQKPYPRLGN